MDNLSNIQAECAKLISCAEHIVIVQAENPDGDSLASSVALEEILGDLGKSTSMYCNVEIPKYLRYISGWDRVASEFDTKSDLAIIVDTTADTLLSKLFEVPGARSFLESKPVLVIDHHTESASTLSFPALILTEEVVSSSHVILNLALSQQWYINSTAATHILEAILSDSLGLITQNVSADSYSAASMTMQLGAHPAAIEEKRREFMKKAPEILTYKGELISRIEYFLDGKLALVHIPFEDIQAYSDKYNPSVLVLDEMRLVEGVELAIAIKTYPDGKVTGKLRSNQPICDMVAGSFGGGGHKYAAGFRVYDTYDTVISELITATHSVLQDINKKES